MEPPLRVLWVSSVFAVFNIPVIVWRPFLDKEEEGRQTLTIMW
jgi:hypothetical protein